MRSAGWRALCGAWCWVLGVEFGVGAGEGRGGFNFFLKRTFLIMGYHKLPVVFAAFVVFLLCAAVLAAESKDGMIAKIVGRDRATTGLRTRWRRTRWCRVTMRW